MGYYINLVSSNFEIPETQAVLEALKSINSQDDIKRGGSFGEKRQFWFSWMPENYDVTVTSVKEVFELLGFEVETNEIISTDKPWGTVKLIGYDNKTGQEDIFLQAVAPYVETYNHLEWRGESGEVWRDVVINGVMHRQQAKLVFDTPAPYDAILTYKKMQESIKKITIGEQPSEEANMSEVS